MPRAQANAVDCLLSAEAGLRRGAGPDELDRRTASAGSICGSAHAARGLWCPGVRGIWGNADEAEGEQAISRTP